MNMEDAMDVKLGMGEGKEDWGFFAIFDGHAGDQASEYLSKNKEKGLYNVGTGFPNTFIEVARIIIKHLGYGKMRFIQFPNHLKNRYQFFTKANINKLRRNGFNNRMLNLNQGIKTYLKQSKFL